MCGIAGWLGQICNPQDALRLVQAMRHRGPDGHGIQAWADATLVHTRLSIIDLSPTGAQPMANEDGTVWTVFNGEIYNHRQLQRELETRGHVFKGRSDTEILPHLFEEYGAGFVDKLRGMFAFAIYDRRSQTLLLARDRFGIKPLFYAPSKTGLAFASEVRALRELPSVDTRPDPQAVYDFSALFYVPAPETFYTGIRALRPGELIEAKLEAGHVSWKARTYFRWVLAPNPSLTLNEATQKADELIHAAVGRQMESDVPLGALLSGGIDSSLVSAAAQTTARGSLKTFNVGFSDKQYDETWAALSVANHIGSYHETLQMDDLSGTWKHVTELLLHAGQPFADTSLFAVDAVCRLMCQRVTVALSGDGGDEGFGGYNLYRQIGTITHWQQFPSLFLQGGSLLAVPFAQLGVINKNLPELMHELSTADNTTILENLWCWIPHNEHERLCLDGRQLLPVRRFFEAQWEHCLPSGANRLERLSAHATEMVTRLTLPNDFLFKVDIASMKESLEVRVPLLDEDLVTFGFSLPHHLKVTGRKCKRVLRNIAKRRLPPAVANKPKWGFGIPVDDWVDADFKARLRVMLLGSCSRLPDFFRKDQYSPLIEAFCEGRPYPALSRQELYQRVIMLLAFQLGVGEKNQI
jgi:asparagine synthase (glutamine-hydrolysing)